MLRIRTALPVQRVLIRLLALCMLLLGLTAVPDSGTAHAAPTFKVLAFYDGTYDAAHISFVHEANQWFPQHAAENGFTYTSTNDWSQLNTANLAKYQVVLFLDNHPQTAAQQNAFKTYMDNGGGWMGFHVSAYNDSTSNSWSWYHNTFLGTGTFKSNTWGPTAETLKVEDRAHPSMAGLPATIASSVSEWYSWNNDLRQNPNIDILASLDPSTFPVGTDPAQTWYSGYYPIIWTNRQYKMLYANFGHNAMNYDTNTALSSTFASAQQNQFLLNGIKWLGGGGASNPGAGFTLGVTPASGTVAPGASATSTVTTAVTSGGTAQSVALTASGAPSGATVSFSPASVTSGGSSTLTVATTSAVAPGTYPISVTGTGSSGTQTATYSLTVTGTGGGSGAITGYGGKCVDVAGASATNGAAVQLYDCNGTAAQSWAVGSDGSVKALGKCMDVTAAGTANGTKVQLYDCNGTTAQKWTPGTNNTLVNAGSGRCLDASGPSSANGTRLQIWTCNSAAANQQWHLPS